MLYHSFGGAVELWRGRRSPATSWRDRDPWCLDDEGPATSAATCRRGAASRGPPATASGWSPKPRLWVTRISLPEGFDEFRGYLRNHEDSAKLTEVFIHELEQRFASGDIPKFRVGRGPIVELVRVEAGSVVDAAASWAESG